MEAEAAKFIGAGLAAMGVMGSGVGLGILFANWIQAIARNPEAADQFSLQGYLGFAMTEAIALFALLISLLLLFAV